MASPISGILDYERRHLSMLKKRLETLSTISEGNAALEPIYSMFAQAFANARSTMLVLRQDLDELKASQIVDPADTTMMQRQGMLKKVLAMARCNEPSPSEIFKQSIRDQRAAIFEQFEHLLANRSISDEQLRDYVEKIGALMCDFDLPAPKEAEGDGFWDILTKVGLVAAGAVAGYQANNWWHKRGWFAPSSSSAEIAES